MAQDTQLQNLLKLDAKDLPEETLKEFGEYVHRKWEEFARSPKRLKKLEDVRESELAYDQDPSDKSQPLWEGASDLVMPFLTISVDQLEPRIVAALVGREDIVRVNDFGKADRDLAKAVEKLNNAVLDSMVMMRDEVKPLVHSVLRRGQAYVQVYWNYEETKTMTFAINQETSRRMPAIDDDGNPLELPPGTYSLGGFQVIESVAVAADGPSLQEVDMEDLFFPEKISDWEKACVVREYYLPWGEYKAMATRNVTGWVQKTEDELSDLEGALFSKRPESGKILDDSTEEDNLGTRDTDASKNKWELRCLEGHFMYDIDGDGIEEKVICTVDEQTKTVLYLMNNAHLDPLNRKQIQKLCVLPDYGTGWGIPLYMKIKAVQNGAAQFVNMLINASVMQMIPVTYYEQGAGFKSQEIEVFPGAHIPVADVTKIHQVSFAPSAAAFKDMVQFFLSLWERLVVVSDYNIGRQKEGTTNTATGTLALLQEASISHDYMGAVLQGQFAKIIQIVHDLCYLNMGDKKAIEILGEPMPRVLSKNFEFQLTASTKSANRHVERMELGEAMAAAEKGVALGLVVPDEPLRDYLGTFKGLHVDRWMNGPLAQLFNRIRMAMQETGEEGEVKDPFGEMVMSMVNRSPEELYAMMDTMDTGQKIEGAAKNIQDKLAQAVGEVV